MNWTEIYAFFTPGLQDLFFSSRIISPAVFLRGFYWKVDDTWCADGSGVTTNCKCNLSSGTCLDILCRIDENWESFTCDLQSHSKPSGALDAALMAVSLQRLWVSRCPLCLVHSHLADVFIWSDVTWSQDQEPIHWPWPATLPTNLLPCFVSILFIQVCVCLCESELNLSGPHSGRLNMCLFTLISREKEAWYHADSKAGSERG